MIVREIHARIGLGQRCVESMVEYDQRQSIVSKYDTQNLKLVYGKACIVYYSNPLCNNTLSQIVVSVSCHMALMIQMANKKMSSTIRCRAWFPRLAKNIYFYS